LVGLFKWRMIRLNLFGNDDTITAIATSQGTAAIALIRISGKKAKTILEKIFVPKYRIENLIPRKAYFGKIVDDGNEIDQVMVIFFKEPKSYTREDLVEINCHGGLYITKLILDLIIKCGARLAEAGEFTKRAFLNGRIDLSQAEAVADLIQAKTEKSLKASMNQLEGILSTKIKSIQNELVELCSLLEIELDFSEEDLEFVNRNEFITKLNTILVEIQSMIDTYKKGKLIREGVKLVIIGRPNVGKSSMLNALLKEDRAIVTEIPGTTRDTLEETIDIKGILFHVVDTAGLIETSDFVEQQGIQRTYKNLQEANIILHIFDGSQKIMKEDRIIINNLLKNYKTDKVIIIGVINKIDLQKRIDLNGLYYSKNNFPIVETSAKKMLGIDKLENILYEELFKNDKLADSNSEDILITKIRHIESLKQSKESLQKAISASEKNLSSEFISVDLREALHQLGQIIGTVTSEDILNNIFEKFCIGK